MKHLKSVSKPTPALIDRFDPIGKLFELLGIEKDGSAS
jgi:hypothetical protein